MATMQERANELDAAEAVAMAGMVLADKVGPVPSMAFHHPGRRALVAYWERCGRIALTKSDREAAAADGKTSVDVIIEAMGDTEASAPLAEHPARLREAQADLMHRHDVGMAQESVLRVTQDYERGNLPAEAVAAAWQRFAEAQRLNGQTIQASTAGDFLPILDSAMAGLIETHSRGWLGLRLPLFPALDGKLCGLRGLMLLGAAPGVGKTQLTLQLGIDAMHDPAVGVVYLSLEMSKQELGYRLLALASQMSYRRLRLGDQGLPAGDGLKLNKADRERLAGGMKQLRSLATRLMLLGSEDIGSMAAGDGDPGAWHRPLVGMVEAAKRRMGTARVLVVVDNLQAIAVEPPHGKPWASDMDRDRTVIEGLTRLQHELADPVMVISEVTKGTFTNTDAMASILGTGRNAYRADAVMLLKRVEDSDTHRIDLIIDKGRDGMERGRVSLEWDKDYTRLSEVSR
jgi:replicative DNA helicase